MNERSLAHIELIKELIEIPGADKIEVAKILGWESVVKKGEFKVGQKICYIEVDAVMPEKPEYEFLRDRNFRIRTIKLRGQISQGLVIPLPITWDTRPIGMDVTGDLGITKYLSPSEREEITQQERKLANEKNKLKKFLMRYSWFRRLFVPKKKDDSFTKKVGVTDENRIQNIPHILEQFKDVEVYVTEKVDYSSGTFCVSKDYKYSNILHYIFPFKTYKLEVYSREKRRFDYNSVWWNIARKYNLEQILKENPNLVIQGECGDTKIQGNKYGITEPTMWVFNIIDHEKNYHYNWEEMYKFCLKHNLQTVPMLCYDKIPTWYPKLSDLGSTVQELIEFSKGKSVLANIQREGIVVRCIENGQKLLSFKVINPEFLLEEKD